MGKKTSGWKMVGKALWAIIKIPYYIVKGIANVISFFSHKVKEGKVKAKRNSITPVYEDLKVIKTEKGDYEKFKDSLYSSDSKIGIILGARGSGKTALGIKLLENIYSQKKKKACAMGFDEKEMPGWIKIVQDISQLENNSFVLIDEGGVYFSARKSMTNINNLLSDLILVSRHKNLTILFVSQNSSNLEVNILRQADFLLLKPSSLLQKNFERKIIQKLYDSTEKSFKKYESLKGIAYIYSNEFQGFITNPLPSFWQSSISKSFMRKKFGTPKQA